MGIEENNLEKPEEIEPLVARNPNFVGSDDLAYDTHGKKYKKISPWSAWRNVTDWREVVKRIDFEALSPLDFARVVIHTLTKDDVPALVNYLQHYLPRYLGHLKGLTQRTTESTVDDDWKGGDYSTTHAIDEHGSLTPEFRRGVLALAEYFRKEDSQTE